MGSDERAIREVHSTWIDAVNAGDLARLLSLMADDVVFLNPGYEGLGRDGFSTRASAHFYEDLVKFAALRPLRWPGISPTVS